MELFQELNQKFQTLDRFRDIPNMGTMVSNRKPGEGGRVGGGVRVDSSSQSRISGVEHRTCDFANEQLSS